MDYSLCRNSFQQLLTGRTYEGAFSNGIGIKFVLKSFRPKSMDNPGPWFLLYTNAISIMAMVSLNFQFYFSTTRYNST